MHMPLIHLDEIDKEYVTPKYSSAFGELVLASGSRSGACASRPTRARSSKDVIGGIGHKMAPGETDRLQELGKA
jgi:hypothetical protein